VGTAGDALGPANPARGSVSVSERLTTLGAYFAADSHDSGTEPPRSPWQSMGALLDDADALAARVEALRGYFAAMGGLSTDSIEVRVAASVMHLGLAARTLSPLFALSVMGLRLPSSSPVGMRDLRWQPALGSSFALSIAGLDRAQPTSAARDVQHADIEAADIRAADIEAADIDSLAGELCGITRGFGVSSRILWGNVASALNGARIALSAADPRLAAVAQIQLDRLLRLPSLAGTSRTAPHDGFQRRSCCLIYRTAPDRRGPVCGDCVLAGQALLICEP
jgi:hypothetical protein